MEVGTTLLSSSSLPPRAHARSCQASSVLALHEQASSVSNSLPVVSAVRSFPGSVFSHQQRDDHRSPMLLVSEETGFQVTLGAVQLRIGSTVEREEKSGDSGQYEKDSDRQLLHWPGLSYLLPPLKSRTKASVSLTTQNPHAEAWDFDLSDAVVLAEKALLASKEAAMLANKSRLL